MSVFKGGLLALLLAATSVSPSFAAPFVSRDDLGERAVSDLGPAAFGVTKKALFDAAVTPIPAPRHAAATFLAPPASFSAVLASIPPDGRSSALYDDHTNTVTIDIAPDANGVAVLAIDTALFHPGATVDLRLHGATSVLINVAIASCPHRSCAYTFDASIRFNDVIGYADQVTWNFPNATEVSFDTPFGGAVVVPLARASIRPAVDPASFLRGFVNSGQLNRYAFADLPPGTVAEARPRNPEPSCWCY